MSAIHDLFSIFRGDFTRGPGYSRLFSKYFKHSANRIGHHSGRFVRNGRHYVRNDGSRDRGTQDKIERLYVL